MRTTKNIYILLAAILFSLCTSCDDFLEYTPNDRITKDNFYQTEEDFQAATVGLYNLVWADFNDKFYFGLGDGRSYNIFAPYSDYIYPFSDLTETGLTGPLVSAWGSLYNVVQQSNRVALGISESSLDEATKRPYIAEARFMRGVAYWYLASLWGDVILCEDPSELVENPIVNTNPVEDVYEFVMRDLEYGAKYLPEEPFQPGRITKYSAYAMLSRVYLAYAGLSDNPNSGTRDLDYLDMAKKSAVKVIEDGPYTLMEDYYDLFMIENNNNTESIFALQWVPNGDWGYRQTQQAYFAASSDITGDDAAWGYYTRASVDVLGIYEPTDVRRRATWMGTDDFYEDINRANGGYLHDIPTSHLNVKKGVVGSNKDNPAISKQNSSLNTYMIRLAEVYLNYVEAALGNNESINEARAREYINTIRKRANVSPFRDITYDDIMIERRRELCMEGQFWYDLVRRAYYEQQEVINFIQGQSRDHIMPFIYDTETNSISEDPEGVWGNRAVGVVDESIFLLPYPEPETVQNPLLREDPVPYEFSEERIILF